MASINLSEAIRNASPTSGYEPLPIGGPYDVVVVGAEFKTSKEAGNPMFAIKFKVEDGELEGKTQYHNITITENNVNIAVGQLEILGADRDDVALAVDDDDAAKARVCGQLIDGVATIKVASGKGDYNGRPNVNVYVNARAGAVPPTPAKGAAKKSSSKAPF
jgi:hypothetical protein